MSSASTAPTSMSIMAPATSSCTKNRRAAEQRWPAESKAERTTSRITCSGSALESAIMALRPPVSAMNGTMAPRRVGQRPLDGPARGVGAGEGDARHARVLDERGADGAGAGQQMQHARAARPPRAAAVTARKATIGVCSAGLASTGLPAASAAATWPVKMASGKFHGEMQANGPRPRSSSVLVSPVGPASATGPLNSRRASAA